MTARFLVLLTAFIAICVTVTAFQPDPKRSNFLVSAAHAEALSPSAQEIARLRGSATSESELEQLNAALFWIVRHYREPELFALLKNSDVSWVLIRATVEQHHRALARAKQALVLKFGTPKQLAEEVRGLSEHEIIALASSL